ncbi:hypothetical protein B0H10DRAFT_1967154 [Mycena sp. CBHHK59/15]|nr:hypothetical protein B0H10DRAFT_1967154 [Mycena sp. CBHHK59/15]
MTQAARCERGITSSSHANKMIFDLVGEDEMDNGLRSFKRHVATHDTLRIVIVCGNSFNCDSIALDALFPHGMASCITDASIPGAQHASASLHSIFRAEFTTSIANGDDFILLKKNFTGLHIPGYHTIHLQLASMKDSVSFKLSYRVIIPGRLFMSKARPTGDPDLPQKHPHGMEKRRTQRSRTPKGIAHTLTEANFYGEIQFGSIRTPATSFDYSPPKKRRLATSRADENTAPSDAARKWAEQ